MAIFGTPLPNEPVAAPTTPPAQNNLQGFSTILQRPDVQAGILQFLVNLAQPRAPGQTVFGSIASDLAAGGQAIGRVQQQQEKRAQQSKANQFQQQQLDQGSTRNKIAREQIRAATARNAATNKARLKAAQLQVDAAAKRAAQAAKDRVVLEGLGQTAADKRQREGILDRTIARGILTTDITGETTRRNFTASQQLRLANQLGVTITPQRAALVISGAFRQGDIGEVKRALKIISGDKRFDKLAKKIRDKLIRNEDRQKPGTPLPTKRPQAGTTPTRNPNALVGK